MKHAKIKEEPGLIRDMNSQAVISNDLNGLSSYKRQREKMKRISDHSKDINNLKEEINDIKSMMQQILQKLG